MTREELQKAYLEMYEKCSALENKNTALEKENEDLKKQNEDKIITADCSLAAQLEPRFPCLFSSFP